MKLCDYIFLRLKQLGIGHVFCIPGESVQELYRALLNSDLQSVLLAHEPSVGYAADAYSRLRGLGAVLVSYGVGSLNMVNAVGQAYAESSPMVILSGGPGMGERRKHSLLHHKVREFDTKQQVFKEITAASLIIDSPIDAINKLEFALQTALHRKKPVYIEIPRDITLCELNFGAQNFDYTEEADPATLKEALDEVVSLLNSASRPVILGGVESARVKMQAQVIELVEKLGLPVACDLLGKSLIPEDHPQSLGVFFGKLSNPTALQYIESADLILSLGVILSDVALGMFTYTPDRTKMIEARVNELRIKNHHYHGLTLNQLISGLLTRQDLIKRTPPQLPADGKFYGEHSNPLGTPNRTISMCGVGEILNNFINRPGGPAYRVISDVGDCLFMGMGLKVKRATSFLSPAYYLSMGFAVPGAIGAQIADPSLRSLVIVGDGAFQMTGLEVISASRLGLNPIVIVFNNGVYATLDAVEESSIPNSYDIGRYPYFKMAELFDGIGYEINTFGELQQALAACEDLHPNKFAIIQVNLEPHDRSVVMQNFGKLMGESNKLASEVN